MSNRPRRNRSNRDRQLARQRARREAQKQNESILYRCPPPFESYKEWFNVPNSAKDHFEHPAHHDDRLTNDAKDLADTLIKLGPRYNGLLPMAAIYLDQQIQRGVINIAITGQPDRYRPIPLADFAADLSNPEFLDQLRSQHPDAGLPEEANTTTDDAVAWHLHHLHALGYLVIDDDHTVNMAVPPKTSNGTWYLNGHDTSG